MLVTSLVFFPTMFSNGSFLKDSFLGMGILWEKRKMLVTSIFCVLCTMPTLTTLRKKDFEIVVMSSIFFLFSCFLPNIWPCAYKTFFMLNSAEHEISKLDKSNLINLLEKLLTCKDFSCFCPSNQSFKFNLPYILKDELSFKV